MSSSSSLLLLLFLLSLSGVKLTTGFKICAFNVQSFGDSKSRNTEVMHTLIRIVSRCDVCLLQEVRDTKQKAIPLLITELNRHNSKNQYDYVASERLGRTPSYQEQYVFVFRIGSVTVTDQYQYLDMLPGNEDAFSREPFIVRLHTRKTAIRDFVLVPQHTTPTNATKEIDALYDVFLDVKKKWKTEMVMFLGDFNADCGYVAKKNRQHVRLYSNQDFLWLIGDTEDTTVRQTTTCAYDRIVVHGEAFAKAIVPQSAQPFNFAREYGLTEEQALDVSDHYPVEVELKAGSEHLAGHTLLIILMAFFIST
ncbi:deoxyribonuclease-1-like 1 [Salvelinus fontinalis]|uniref:deoxyribonuclease-1-like 1 n=1 Tax=Salvelinus fontinalis TaxID=8038 RepID=UPI00248645E5|nr:deoxyribonuclease-1-like 1 [Salvelinus fontinalis]XP_055788742.1 deoxyribonuclease-1-like 1 [Salvelinus fontinalis]XP_055788743.1 deoxyribonuclease-1-like 1 [Salvelinus fontinalis]XP_055788745.1 deoxyribonuclease-1-like 1 [Salvelinus fontinalis]